MITDIHVHRTRDIKATHPCFSKEAHDKFGRIHLPVAPSCNIQCRYCIRKYDCANESRPGITSRVMKPHDALARVKTIIDRQDRITVVGIAGPGDPLANEATFEVMSSIHREFPELTLCVSTNGLNLPERLDDLIRCGVRSLTVTINAVTPDMAGKVYSWANYKGKRYTGREAGACIVNNQWRGLTNAIDAGLMVKVNTVYIPGVNDAEIPLIAWHAGERGADIMNIMPLIPQAEFEGREGPTREMISRKRAACERHLPQMTS